MATAAAALSRVFPLATSQRRYRGFAISHSSCKYECNMLVMSSSIVVLKGRNKRRHYSCSVSCLSTTVMSPERSNMLEELSLGIDGRHESPSDDDSELFSQLQDLFTEIKLKIKNREMEDVLQLLEANYELVKEEMENGSKGIEQAAILDVLALGYFASGDVKTARRILLVMDDIISSINEGGILLDTILYHMGSLFHSLGKFSDAIRVYERCLKILEKECGKGSALLREPLLGLAKALQAKRRPREAIPVYKRVVDILEKKKGVNSVEVCEPLHSLGNLLLSIGETEDARLHLQRVLEIHKESYGEKDGRTGLALCSFAEALCAKGDMDGAIAMYKKGLEVIKDANDIPLHDDSVEMARLHLAELLHTSGRLREGREVLQESHLINQKRWGIGHPSSVAHLMNLATSYSRSKNYIEAERLLRTSLNIMSKSLGPANQATTVPMVHLAVILFHLKQFEEAESLALEAWRIREITFGPESGPVGEALDCLVAIQAVLERDEGEMLEKLKRVLRIQERLMGRNSEEVAITLHKIVFYLDKLGKNDEKVPYQRRLSVLTTKLNKKFIF
ncbi:Nephrocystin-3 [Rhynchospora pubera]|uniref:Nephrocystin-3 n=1 Tax=Rhynchospora pubera TaxID=906938 RepID=A0AAV8EU00_9POAL|nr:Nephrocystin-3 [Rhynchospora pubera]